MTALETGLLHTPEMIINQPGIAALIAVLTNFDNSRAGWLTCGRREGKKNNFNIRQVIIII